jgi:hypothetical protein
MGTDQARTVLDLLDAMDDRLVEGCVPEDLDALIRTVRVVWARHRPGRNVVLGATCLVHENHRLFSITDFEAAAVDACPDCEAATYVSCAACGDHVPLERCPDRVAITRELTRGGGTGED